MTILRFVLAYIRVVTVIVGVIAWVLLLPLKLAGWLEWEGTMTARIEDAHN